MSSLNAIPNCMLIYKRNVYACGSVTISVNDNEDLIQAAYWIDNVMVALDSDNQTACAKSISVHNDSIAVVGNINFEANSKAVCWLNGKKRFEKDGACLLDVKLSSKELLACGYVMSSDGYRLATIWQEGVEQIVGDNNSMASFITKINNDVYVIGVSGYNGADIKDSKTTIWKNNEMLEQIVDKPTVPTGMCIYDNKLYIVGLVGATNDAGSEFFVYRDGDLKFYNFVDELYVPKSISVSGDREIIALEKIEYVIDGSYQTSSAYYMLNDEIEKFDNMSANNVSPISIVVR